MKTQAYHHIKSSIIPNLILVLMLYNVSFAQNTHIDSIQWLPLHKLKGYTQTFYYSQGSAERATSIAMIIENAGTYFQDEIGFTPKTTLYMLGPNDWKDFAAKPYHDIYGFPHNPTPNRLVIATEDNDFWRSFLPQLDQLPTHIVADIRKAYGTPDGSISMMPFFDLLALHELGHSYTAQAGLKMHRHSMGELFVNIMLHTYIAEKLPELLPALEAFPNMVLAIGTAEYKYTSLTDFEELYPTLGMGPKNYGWYQAKLHSAAKEIYNSGGKIVLKKLWEALKNHQEDLTDSEFIAMLNNEVHPSVANIYLHWNQTNY